MKTIRITTPQNIDIDYEAASLGDRLLGYLIDIVAFVVLWLVFVIIGLAGMDGFGNVGIGVPLVLIILAFIYVFYDLLMEVLTNGQSIGKKVMKIRVISLDGGRPSLGQYLIRWLLRLVDSVMTGGLLALLSIIFSEKHQRIGDIAAGTVVVKTHSRTTAKHLVFVPPTDNHVVTFPSAIVLTDHAVNIIHEVLASYRVSGNTSLIYATARKAEQQLSVTVPQGMDDLTFLKTVLNDYNQLVADTGKPDAR